MNKYTKEEIEFLNLLKSENAIANPVFKSKLKAKMLKEANPQKGIFGFFFTPSIGFLSIIFFSFTSIGLGFLYLSELNVNRPIQSNISSSDLKQEIVERVAQKSSINTLSLITSDISLSSIDLELPERPQNQEFNFRTTEVTYTPIQNSIGTCGTSLFPTQVIEKELNEYFTDQGAIVELKENGKQVLLEEISESDILPPTSFPVSFPPSFPVSFPEFKGNSILRNLANELEILEIVDGVNTTYKIIDYILTDCTNSVVSFPVSFTKSSQLVVREIILNQDLSIKDVNLYNDSITEENKFAEINISVKTNTVSEEEAREMLISSP